MEAVSLDARSEREACDSSAMALGTPRYQKGSEDRRARSGARIKPSGARGIASRTIIRVMLEVFLSITLLLRHFAKHRYGFDFDQQLGTTQLGLNAGRCGQRIETLLVIEGGTLLVELRVVAINVAQVTGGADDVLPGGTFGCE